MADGFSTISRLLFSIKYIYMSIAFLKSFTISFSVFLNCSLSYFGEAVYVGIILILSLYNAVSFSLL